MGIPSLNIGIKIKFDFPFCHHFDDIVQISRASAKKTAVFLAAIHHPKWPYQGTSAKSSCQINWNLSVV